MILINLDTLSIITIYKYWYR